MSEKILVIDEGTSSTRAMIFTADGTIQGSAHRPIPQSYPAPSYVEQDAEVIWQETLACAQTMVAKAGGADKITAIGLTNQRETIVFWHRASGKPLAPAIVWQDRRTSAECAALRATGAQANLQALTGLLLDPYFSASKIGWALKNYPQLRAAGDQLAVGTIESYLIYRLTGGVHVSDASNAARTALMAIDQGGGWDDSLCAMFGVPRRILPEIVGCMTTVGTALPEIFGGAIPICGMVGDQQAATIGQGCLAPGQTKATYGTGAFILTSCGDVRPHSDNRLLATILYADGDSRYYALEGSLFVAGNLIHWLHDSLGLLTNAGESEALARSVSDSGGVYLVPALSGLGAPHWQSHARAAISGLSLASTRAHIVRAALESMAYQTQDLRGAFAADGVDWNLLRIDGGMVANDWLAQDLSDILVLSVERPTFIESTALGAAMLAATGAGIYDRLPEAVNAMRCAPKVFEPSLAADIRAERLAGWRVALDSVLRTAC